jgi:tetratricopeptide (TPR) repeat protein
MAAVVLALTFLSWRQTSLWVNSRTIFAHTLAVTSDNWLGDFSYGLAMLKDNRVEDYRRHILRAATLNPNHAISRYHLGRIAAESGQTAEAERWFAETVRLKPDYADAHYSRGAMLMALGRPAEALPSFERALQSGLAPEFAANAHAAAGVVLANSGKLVDAEKRFREALRQNPSSAEAQRNLRNVNEALKRLGARP